MGDSMAEELASPDPPPRRKVWRKGWWPKKRRCRQRPPTASSGDADADAALRKPGRPVGSTALAQQLPDPESRQLMTMPTSYLWAVDYKPIFARELEIYQATGLLAKAGQLLNAAPASTYLRRNLSSEGNLAKRMGEDVMALMRWCAEAVHRRNHKVIPPSMATRSISLLSHKASQYVWGRDGSVVGRVTARTLVSKMAACQPDPPFRQSLRMFFYVGDQVFRNAEKRHSRKKDLALQHIDGTGAKFGMAWQKETFFNFFRVPLPSALVRLTQGDLDLIRAVGPFTKGYGGAYTLLQPSRVRCAYPDHHHKCITHSAAGAQVKRMLHMWCTHFGAQILLVASRNGCSVAELPPAQIARAFLARPDIDPGGKTCIEIGKPIVPCDTKSYDDMHKIMAAYREDAEGSLLRLKAKPGHSTDGLQPEESIEDMIFACLGDGQCFDRQEGAVKHWPGLYRNFVSLKGPFHSEAHFLFASHETFAPSLTIWAAGVLERDIDESNSSLPLSPSPFDAPDMLCILSCAVCQTLDKGEYLLYREFRSEVSVAILQLLILDISFPPPDLLLTNMSAYTKLVQHAGGKVLCKYLRYAGYPGQGWLFAQRASKGAALLELDAFTYHMCRATAHKPNYVSYSAMHIATHVALHPSLRYAIESTMSISPLGKKGSNMGDDRYQEALNKIQEQRDGLGGNMDTKLHTGPSLWALMHGAHARDFFATACMPRLVSH